MPQSCAICRYLGTVGGGATNLVGLLTGVECILNAAETRLDDGDAARPHIMAYVCAVHVVDIYRDRVPGVVMAWLTTQTP